MTCLAIIDRFISNKVKKDSLTITEKYRFDDFGAASFFAENLKRIDRRVVSYRIKQL